MMFYDLPDDTISIAHTDFSQIAYIFWKNKYVGYAIFINDKKQRHQIKARLTILNPEQIADIHEMAMTIPGSRHKTIIMAGTILNSACILHKIH